MKNLASFTLMVIYTVTIIFHLLVVTSIVPQDIVWGGRLEDPKIALILEGVSIIINAIFLFIILIYRGVLKVKLSQKWINIALKVMFAVFILNTIGNMFSENEIEKVVFTPLTLLISIALGVLIFNRRIHPINTN